MSLHIFLCLTREVLGNYLVPAEKKNTLRVMKNLPEQNCKSKSGEGIEGGQIEQRRKETLRLTPRFPVRAAVLLCEETPGSHAI